ncbi:MAG: long-chain fatty acid--CoA ligase [Syntrophales bacterium]|nr:long-chain fatty acid--CoA ligase [Syntrophales bacterium]MDD4339272.1 long-chain fatty acid--CoA ligase [Syntrophales bacterium]HPB70958.1 long-chain fatty acid--CoA ligase [Syntrophales bacterium]HQN26425.1 long-chain fatty acid--CoA ligase [Syntrophales bacterium]HQP28253.1 long-chain fatty acid--CoA ligase [Syntrophales bacterium]
MSEERIWQKAYMPGVPKTVSFEDRTMPEFLTRTARRFPRRDALIYLGRRISFAELDRLADRFASALKAIGVKKGDRVALLLPNVPQIVIAYFGIWRAGAAALPCNPLYSDREIEHQVNLAGASVMITLDLFAPRMLALRSRTGIRQVIAAHINDYLPTPQRQLFPFVKRAMYLPYRKEDGYHDFMALMRAAPDQSNHTPPALDDLALIPYTGGTTGVSKGAIISHRNISSINQILMAWFFDLPDGEDSELAIFPFFHMAGFNLVMNLSICKGWTAILVPRPDPQAVMDLTRKYRPTIFLAVPTIYVGVMALPEFRKSDLSFIKGFFSGAAPLLIETIEALKKATGASIVEGLGMTESTSIITMTPWRGKLKPGSVGVPLPNTDVKIVDLETGETDLPPGAEGEICFRGPQMCGGYYGMPEETERAVRGGWFYSGDIGRMDEEGYIYVVDRKKDMIIAGGYNIYPREIDEVLYEHPGVLEACTVGVPHEYRGETVKAFIVVKPGVQLNEKELDAFCRERLAAYKVPKLYEFTDNLPKSAVGKILRRELRDRAAGA